MDLYVDVLEDKKKSDMKKFEDYNQMKALDIEKYGDCRPILSKKLNFKT